MRRLASRILWLTCLTLPASSAEVLLPLANGDFEQGAEGWVIRGGDPFTTIAAAPGGGHAMRIADDDPRAGSSATSSQVAVDQPGSYALRGRVYPESGNGLGLYLRYYAGPKLLAGLERNWGFGGDQKVWLPFDYTFIVPPGVTAVELWVHSYNASQVTAWLDDFQLVQVNVREGDLAKDMAIIKERLTAEVLAGTPNEGAATNYRDTLQNGQWPDVDYTDGGRTRWEPANHVSRLQAMALALVHPQSKLKDDATLQQAVFEAFDWWTTNNPQCPNWWWNVIGVPMSFNRTMLLIDDRLTPERHEAGIKILEQAKLGMTGQNLVWVAQISVARGCLAGRAWEVYAAFDAMTREVKITGGEGIQADFSFYQHGTQLYSGGYGRGFAVDTPHNAALAAGTSFAMSPEKVAILEGYLLDGEQWMSRGQRMDYSACGREITRRGAARADGYRGACLDLAKLNPPRKAELETFAQRLTEPALKQSSPLIGNRAFWRSDYVAHHRAGYMASVRMTSKRMLQSELVNEENLLGKHLSDGVTFLYRDGDEYDGVFPVWDWQKLPGTTVAQDGKPQLRNGARGETDFASGVSDGMDGLAAMDFRRGPLQARKAWFMTDAGYLAAGAGIASTGGEPVVTTINQCLLRSEVTWEDASGRHTAKTGEQELKGVRWVHHDQTGYLFLTPADVHLRAAEQTGSWYRINHAQSKDEVKLPVFSLWYDHGVKPTGARYVYLVLPGVSVEQLAALASQPPAKVLVNEPTAQVFTAGKLVAVALYTADAVDTPLGKLKADRPCLVMVRDTGQGLEVTVADPTHGTAPLTVTVDARTETFTLPEQLYAGQSVTEVLK